MMDAKVVAIVGSLLLAGIGLLVGASVVPPRQAMAEREVRDAKTSAITVAQSVADAVVELRRISEDGLEEVRQHGRDVDSMVSEASEMLAEAQAWYEGCQEAVRCFREERERLAAQLEVEESALEVVRTFRDSDWRYDEGGRALVIEGEWLAQEAERYRAGIVTASQKLEKATGLEPQLVAHVARLRRAVDRGTRLIVLIGREEQELENGRARLEEHLRKIEQFRDAVRASLD